MTNDDDINTDKINDNGDASKKVDLPLNNNTTSDELRFSINEKDIKAANDEAMQMRLVFLMQEHNDLDKAIIALENQPTLETLVIARLKKKKLRLKDEMSFIRTQLEPDIIA